jgi:uridine phosphorylase
VASKKVKQNVTFPKAGEKHDFEPIITANDVVRKDYQDRVPRVPTKVALIFDRHLQAEVEKMQGFLPVKLHPLATAGYVSGDRLLAVVRLAIGAPLTSIVVEDLIVMGAREFLILGTAGGLEKPHAGDIVLCSKALRDDGTSHHYLPESKFVLPEPGFTEALGSAMKEVGVSFRTGPTWTIDAPYTESRQELTRYVKEGILTVEMEAAALFAVAKVRGVKAAAVFVVSDILTEGGWSGFVVGREPKDFEDILKVLQAFRRLALPTA